MQIKRTAIARWSGPGKTGKGALSTGSGVLKDTQYGFISRFSDGPGTNPEELLGAAHAGCFSMKLAFNLQSEGITPDEIETTATVIFTDGVIARVELATKVKAASLTESRLEKIANDAKNDCPVSKVLKCPVSLRTELEA
jgi:osmotically inducible protein OsmC